MKEDMIIAFETAVESHGQDAAEKAAEASIEAYNTAAIAGLNFNIFQQPLPTSIEAYNTAAIAGLPENACDAEQLAAFEAALNG